MANNNSDRAEPFHEVPTRDYFWLEPNDILVHKAFFKYYTLALMLSISVSTAVLCLTNWWQIFFTYALTNIYLKAPLAYIGWPATLVFGIYIYYRYNKRQKEKVFAHRAYERKRAVEDAQITLSRQEVKKHK